MSDHAGTVVLKAVLPERKRLAGFALSGYKLAGVEDSGMAIAVWTAQVLMDLLTESSEERPITVTFSKPPCPMPLRGYARKRPCKETGHKITDQQRHFLASFCDAHEVKHSQPCASTVFEAMKSNFGDLTMDPATQRPILLDETQIFNWLKTRWAATKTAAVHVAAAAAMAAGAAGEVVDEEEEEEEEDGDGDD